MCLSSCTGFPVNSPETTAMLRWNSTGQRNQSLSARRWSRDSGVAKWKWPGSLGAKRFSVAPKLKPTLANSDSHGQQPVDIHL